MDIVTDIMYQLLRPLLILVLETTGVCALMSVIVWGVIRILRSLSPQQRNIKRNAPNAIKFLNEFNSCNRSFIDYARVQAWDDLYRKTFDSLNCVKRKLLEEDVLRALDIFSNLSARVNDANERFIAEESASLNEFFGRLDKGQREACIADEVATLVVAGAGSGKTSTIQKKVEYLVKSNMAKQDEILLLSFTNKAADEMTDRLAAVLPDMKISATTFHKFGLGVVKKYRGGSYDIADPRLCEETILHALSPESMTDDECRGLLKFFSYCYNTEPNESKDIQTFGDYIRETKTADFRTLRELVADYTSCNKTSYAGEIVKSFEELEIANWLFLNGINYEYERKYDGPIEDNGTHRVYKPDFYLPDYKIWIEHFGVDKEGNPPSFFRPADRQSYIEGMAWKRELHKKNGTTLVESYSWWHKEGVLTDLLWERLQFHGVKRKGIDPKPVWMKLVQNDTSHLVREFAKLVAAFISLAKSNRIKPEGLDALLSKMNESGLSRVRARAFFAQVSPLYRKYEEILKRENALDFHDMINEAADIIASNSSVLPKYKYVIVDEFQDISNSRKDLLRATIASTGAKIFAVGDDWQSIYRFAGSDISIFTHFADNFGYTRIIKLENTYRNSKELLAIAGPFVMKNASQIKKNLISAVSVQDPILCLPITRNGEKVALDVFDKIAKETPGKPKSILVLARHNKDLTQVMGLDGFSVGIDAEHLIWKAHPEIKISCMTVHKAKGLEADYTILLNFKDDILGFPNKVSDDPVLSLLLAEAENVAYAEERRVFYVAITRAKIRTYILTPIASPSVFLEDLPIEVKGAMDVGLGNAVACPKCVRGHLIIRKSKQNTNEKFYGCSNFPRCDYTLPLQEIPITNKTPRCSCGGFIVPLLNPKNNQMFLGCTEYGRLPTYPHDSHPMPESSTHHPEW